MALVAFSMAMACSSSSSSAADLAAVRGTTTKDLRVVLVFEDGARNPFDGLTINDNDNARAKLKNDDSDKFFMIAACCVICVL